MKSWSYFLKQVLIMSFPFTGCRYSSNQICLFIEMIHSILFDVLHNRHMKLIEMFIPLTNESSCLFYACFIAFFNPKTTNPHHIPVFLKEYIDNHHLCLFTHWHYFQVVNQTMKQQLFLHQKQGIYYN